MKKQNKTSRRTFVKTSAKTLAAGMVFSHLPIFSSANVLGQEKIKLGLVGCGGRGTGAIFQALTASKSVQLVAMGDVFKHELDNSLQQVATKFSDQVAVPKERQFLGLDAFEKVIAECDAVILATPPGFRPQHFQHAIDAGKHVFLEKPLAVDGPGYRKIIETGEKATEKKLNVVVGLQFRYEIAMNEMVTKIHSGEIGDVLSADVYYNVGKATVHPRKEGQTELEYQISNWHYFNWLWGGQLAGQAIHQIDVINWIKQAYPIKASGMGGRAMLEGPIIIMWSSSMPMAQNCTYNADKWTTAPTEWGSMFKVPKQGPMSVISFSTIREIRFGGTVIGTTLHLHKSNRMFLSGQYWVPNPM